MTLEEALGKLTDPELRQFFENMTKNQNSYITKLETQLKEQKAAGNQSPASTDSITQAWIQKQMRAEVIAKSVAKIIEAVGQDVYNAVKAEFDEFLDKNLKPENTTEAYVLDAFNLVYGRCFAKKDHPVHQIGKAANPGGTPTPQPLPTNGQQVAQVQNVIAGQPPVMTGADPSAGQGLPGINGTPVKNTKDAFSRLKDKFAGNGGNRFQ